MVESDRSPIATTLVAPVVLEAPFELFTDWNQAIKDNEELLMVQQAVQEEQRKLPSKLLLKLSIAECSIIDGRLMFRNRL